MAKSFTSLFLNLLEIHTKIQIKAGGADDQYFHTLKTGPFNCLKYTKKKRNLRKCLQLLSEKENIMEKFPLFTTLSKRLNFIEYCIKVNKSQTFA